MGPELPDYINRPNFGPNSPIHGDSQLYDSQRQASREGHRYMSGIADQYNSYEQQLQKMRNSLSQIPYHREDKENQTDPKDPSCKKTQDQPEDKHVVVKTLEDIMSRAPIVLWSDYKIKE